MEQLKFTPADDPAAIAMKQYSLFDALLNRRSRRFGKGMRLNGGPLAYESQESPQPLTPTEEATLAFAACGITGYALGELPYDTGDVPAAGDGNIMIHLVGRTVPSGDSSHAITVFVINDEGTWFLKRPQDFPRHDITGLIAAAREQRLVELYERGRVRIAATRLEVPRDLPYVTTFNKWSGNVPGTTVFLPVAELTGLAINILLVALSEASGYFLLDDRRNYRPAGLGQFARSKGGHLYDDPALGRVATVSIAQEWLYEFAALEQGAVIQNLSLMAAALNLGGFPYFAAHPYIWTQTLGFRMEQLPFTRTIGAGPLMSQLIRLLKRDIPVPTAVGLEHEGQVLIKPYCPPYYRNMEEAVLAFVDYKWGTQGTLKDNTATGWQDAPSVQTAIPRPDDKAIAATIAYCDYVYKRYGRFPPGSGPFRTVLAYQAHHLDEAFYRQFYRSEAFTPFTTAQQGDDR